MEIIFIPADEMKSVFAEILLKNGFQNRKAETCADIFVQNSLDGVISHGVNRFPRFIQYIRDGYVKPDAEPTLISSSGATEQWDGNLGPGPLNALFATERAMKLAEKNGIALVAMANTNHWMRGGTYGWNAAKKGFLFIGWTNTIANMPAWGAKDPRLGNNPLVIAVPYGNEAIVLDFAMSLYSWGKIETCRLNGEKLPFPGGYDRQGRLTDDPSEIIMTGRVLPAGYWKGSGLALLLDILATVISGGKPTFEITKQNAEYGLSQVFIAVNPENLFNYPSMENSVRLIIEDFKKSIPEVNNQHVRYPGEKALKTRKENLINGIPVNKQIWDTILNL